MTTRSFIYPAALSMLLIHTSAVQAQVPFPVPDTAQTTCYDTAMEIACPLAVGEEFFGQDAQHNGTQPSFSDNGDGTVSDHVTGLTWVKTPDLNGDGTINIADKLSYDAAAANAADFKLAGHDDWRLPTIKEMYSLMDFRGVDPSGFEGTDTSGLVPFIDRKYFDFGWGDTHGGERLIDAQMASSNLYVSLTQPGNQRTMFGVNFADGRIKGYGLALRGQDKLFYIMYVRGPVGYGSNEFIDNGNGTLTDAMTGLMWEQADSGSAMNWSDALTWADTRNAEAYLGYNDWRLPNVKELQILVDYTRAPDTTNSAAIDPMFQTTSIINEASEVDFPFYWSSTTHTNFSEKPGAMGAYVSFGRAMGYMESWSDVHGAGAQRSDPKTGAASDYPQGHGPQGDAIRILNYVRLVRDVY